MGFSTITAQIIFFVGVVLLGVLMIKIMNTQIGKLSTSFETKADLLKKRIETMFEISSISGNHEKIEIYVRNTGSTIIDPKKIDVFINGKWIDRNTISVSIESSTDIKNKGLLDPDEIAKIEVKNLNLDVNKTAIIKVEFPYGVSREKRFTPTS